MGKLIAVIGAGGKTTTVRQLAAAVKNQRVLITTTTHMQPILPPESRAFLSDPAAQDLLMELEKPGILCAGVPAGPRKIGSLTPELLQAAADRADYVFCEADGAKCCPLKLHKDYEPVVPDWAAGCLIVAGLSALGRPVSEAVHRYQLNPAWEQEPQHKVNGDDILYCLREAVSTVKALDLPIYLFLNQTDTVQNQQTVDTLLSELKSDGCFCRAGSLQQDENLLADWLLSDF